MKRNSIVNLAKYMNTSASRKCNERGTWVSHYERERAVLMMILVTAENDRSNPVRFNGGGLTEEGSSYWGEEIWMDSDGTVLAAVETEGSDCDGRLSTSAEYLWDGTESEWTRLDQGQRDYSAEYAGY